MTRIEREGINIERLSGDYIRGYTKAVQDIIEIFEYIQEDLNAHKKRFSNKIALQLLQTILENREAIREQRKGFIRWNYQKNGFEFFKGD